MLSNAYFLAKFRFDTAENEPAKNLQNVAKIANFANPHPHLENLLVGALRVGLGLRDRRPPVLGVVLGGPGEVPGPLVVALQLLDVVAGPGDRLDFAVVDVLWSVLRFVRARLRLVIELNRLNRDRLNLRKLAKLAITTL